jgi:hypothetical protein
MTESNPKDELRSSEDNSHGNSSTNSQTAFDYSIITSSLHKKLEEAPQVLKDMDRELRQAFNVLTAVQRRFFSILEYYFLFLRS